MESEEQTVEVSENSAYEGQCGENVFYSFDAEAKVLTITGTGDMYDFNGTWQLEMQDTDPLNPERTYAPWSEYRDDILSVYIEDGVTRIVLSNNEILVNEESIFQLFDKMDTGADAIIFSADGRMFPTVGIYKKIVLPQVKKQINSGNYRLMELLNSVNTQYVEAKYPQQFKNINTPQDYSKI